MRIHLEKIRFRPIASLLDEGPAFDPLAEAIRQLQAAIEHACSLNAFIGFCAGLGLDINQLEAALADRAELMARRGLSRPFCSDEK